MHHFWFLNAVRADVTAWLRRAVVACVYSLRRRYYYKVSLRLTESGRRTPPARSRARAAAAASATGRHGTRGNRHACRLATFFQRVRHAMTVLAGGPPLVRVLRLVAVRRRLLPRGVGAATAADSVRGVVDPPPPAAPRTLRLVEEGRSVGAAATADGSAPPRATARPSLVVAATASTVGRCVG